MGSFMRRRSIARTWLSAPGPIDTAAPIIGQHCRRRSSSSSSWRQRPQPFGGGFIIAPPTLLGLLGWMALFGAAQAAACCCCVQTVLQQRYAALPGAASAQLRTLSDAFESAPKLETGARGAQTVASNARLQRPIEKLTTPDERHNNAVVASLQLCADNESRAPRVEQEDKLAFKTSRSFKGLHSEQLIAIAASASSRSGGQASARPAVWRLGADNEHRRRFKTRAAAAAAVEPGEEASERAKSELSRRQAPLLEQDQLVNVQLVELLGEFYAHTRSIQARFNSIWRQLESAQQAKLTEANQESSQENKNKQLNNWLPKNSQTDANHQLSKDQHLASIAAISARIKMQLGANQESLMEWIRDRQERFSSLRNVTIKLINEPPNKTINVCEDGPKILVMPNANIFYCYTRDQWIEKLWSDLRFSTFHYPFLLLNMIIFVLGTFGNMFVCLSVKRNHQLRNVTNYFIVNLAFADFLVILICLPATVVWDLSLTWFFDTILCKSIMFLQDVSISVSVLTLTAISIDRYYAICHPLKFKSNLSQAKRIIALIWAVSLLIMAPDLVYLSAKPSADLSEAGLNTVLYSDCNYDWSEDASRAFQFVKTILLYLIPFLLMFCAHFRILRALRQAAAASSPGPEQPVSSGGGGDCVLVIPAAAVATPPSSFKVRRKRRRKGAGHVEASNNNNHKLAYESAAYSPSCPSIVSTSSASSSSSFSSSSSSAAAAAAASDGVTSSGPKRKARVRFGSARPNANQQQRQQPQRRASGHNARLQALLHGMRLPLLHACGAQQAHESKGRTGETDKCQNEAQKENAEENDKQPPRPIIKISTASDELGALVKQTGHLSGDSEEEEPAKGRQELSDHLQSSPSVAVQQHHHHHHNQQQQQQHFAPKAPVKLARKQHRESETTLILTMHNQSKLESRRKAAKMLTAIVVLFGFCYLPVHLINFLRQFIEDIPQTDVTSTISMLAHCFCYLNSAINPIIYNHMNSVFRAEFRKFLSCFYECCPRKRTELQIHEQQLKEQIKFKQQLQQNQLNNKRHSSFSR